MNPLWLPSSRCGAHCRTSAAANGARAVLRLAGCIAVLLAAVPLAPLFALLRGRSRRSALRVLAGAVVRSLGVRLLVRGSPPRTACLLVANHVSWLDPVVLMAVVPARTIAKHHVRSWPVVGLLVVAVGTIFVNRSRPKTLPGTVSAAAAALRGGSPVAAFPEGTTTCGAGAVPFRPAIFQAAIDANAPVVPIALRYDQTTATFVGADGLLGSVWRVAAARSLTVSLTVTPTLFPEPGADRRILARAADNAVAPSERLVATARVTAR